MAKKRTLAAIFSILALCLALVGCGGSGSKKDGVSEEDFVGVWQMNSIETGDEEMDEDDFDDLAEMGYYAYLTLEDDGDATLEYFGETLEGEWEYKSGSKCTITFEGESVKARLKGDTLTLENDDDETMGFVRIDEDDKVESDSASATTIPSDDSDDVDETIEELDVVVFDDENYTMTITGRGNDFSGDACLYYKIENHTDQAVYVTSDYGTFSVDGKMCDPIFGETIQGGMYVEGSMWWTGDDVEGAENLVSVKGTIIVEDEDYNELASYALSVD